LLFPHLNFDEIRMRQWIDTITGTILLIFAVIVYSLIPSQITLIETESMTFSPAFYPRLVIAALATLSFLYVVSSFFKKKFTGVAEEKIDQRETVVLGEYAPRTLITIMIVLGYIYLLEFFGFLLATPLGLGVLTYHMGNRSIKTFVLVIVIPTLVIYLFFEKVMIISLPKGTIFY
jgi:putative tricarboxylic transport membrane protein